MQTQIFQLMLKISGVKPIVQDRDNVQCKLLLLSEGTKEEDFPEEIKLELTSERIKLKNYTFSTGNENLNYAEVTSRIIPPNLPSVASFETVGHLAHLNLRNEHLPFRFLIGQIIIDRCPLIKTVVNKTANIENEFRVLPLEVIAGEDNTQVTLKEHGSLFRFDYRTVYWNSRLQQEHQFIASLCSKSDIVVDLFAGVGPFAVPMAQAPQNAHVYANDLNPACYNSLIDNVSLNHIRSRVIPLKLDGREAVRFVMSEIIRHGMQRSAAAFNNRTNNISSQCVYRLDPKSCELDLREVRDVAPLKVMICASFRLPFDVAFDTQNIKHDQSDIKE
ncbi:MAG: putative tRNA -methyltransferase [Streblomastix strix]|uniref:tRNA (guanine(37)-N1)-methyltransferase n=1 Tax=Streblomastix strix TaxID=222440 RepID=A0A5J4W9J5_9EUKA|nr:MAG: putative tRNA -methyltransferase [Streblomastix strix]